MPVHSQLASLGKYNCFCSSEPWRKIAEYAPLERPLYIVNDILALVNISFVTVESIKGKFCPPNSSSISRDSQPPSLSLSKATLKLSGVRTIPFSNLHPCSSPSLLEGEITSLANFPASSKIVFVNSGNRSL